MAKRQFKTESKRILDLMINSIYTHREIFLRELISNASDAVDKLYFQSLTDHDVSMAREDFAIDIAVDKAGRTLSISDNGIGMTKDDLADNLGTIARSGTLAFKNEHEIDDDIDIIGQFGVGFYSAFMVAQKITVRSRAYGAQEAWQWESTGQDGYTLTQCDKPGAGTEIVLLLKDNTESENYDEFLEPYRIQALVKKYSDYIRYPVRMDMERSKKVEDSDEWESVTENVTMNSMVPVWRKAKADLAEGEYQRFYQEKFFDMDEPLKVIHTQVEGSVSYTALLYIPKKPPFNFFSKEFQKGLQLYSNGVMIMENCQDLLPDFFGFVKGLVDSSDFSLNISREILQHDRQLKVIASNLQKKIKAELAKMLKDEREAYEQFFQSFGITLKYGLYSGYGQNRDVLEDLVMFHSLAGDGLVTLREYVDAMPEGQEAIYYAAGESPAQIARLPQLERVNERGYDVLCLSDDVDEFTLKMLATYAEKPFKSVADAGLELQDEDEKAQLEEKSRQTAPALEGIKAALEGQVDDVRLTARLKSHPVCLSSEGEISLEMEKVLNAMPMDEKVKARRILEINADHPIRQTLVTLAEDDPEKLQSYARLLLGQAMLIEGMALEDPVEFSNLVCELM